jgi:hypothetical protein
MALKAGTPEFEKWRKKNYNLNIRVPESAIQKLRDGKTKSNNIKRFAGTDSKVMREAMNRFYGKGWENGVSSSGGGGKGGSNNGGGTKRNAPNPGGKGPNRRGFPSQRYDGKDMNPGAYDRSGKATGKSKGKAGSAEERYWRAYNKAVGDKNAKPITSIGSFGQGGYEKKAKALSSYKTLNAGEKALLETVLLTVLIPGVGGAAVKGAVAVKGAIQGARIVNLGNKAGAAGKFFVGKGSKVIMNNTTKVQQQAVIRSVKAAQARVWAKVAKGQLTKAQARKASVEIYNKKVGALWNTAAKKAGKLR